jgi:hypothetical protein
VVAASSTASVLRQPLSSVGLNSTSPSHLGSGRFVEESKSGHLRLGFSILVLRSTEARTGVRVGLVLGRVSQSEGAGAGPPHPSSVNDAAGNSIPSDRTFYGIRKSSHQFYRAAKSRSQEGSGSRHEFRQIRRRKFPIIEGPSDERDSGCLWTAGAMLMRCARGARPGPRRRVPSGSSPQNTQEGTIQEKQAGGWGSSEIPAMVAGLWLFVLLGGNLFPT